MSVQPRHPQVAGVQQQWPPRSPASPANMPPHGLYTREKDKRCNLQAIPDRTVSLIRTALLKAILQVPHQDIHKATHHMPHISIRTGRIEVLPAIPTRCLHPEHQLVMDIQDNLHHNIWDIRPATLLIPDHLLTLE